MGSTFHHLRSRWSPSLSREGNVSQAILLWSLGCLPFYKRLFHIPLQSPWGCITLWALAHTDLKMTTPFSLTCESSDSHRQQTKCAAFILSLQNGKRDVCFSFAELLPTCLFKREHPASPLWPPISTSNLSFPHRQQTYFATFSFLRKICCIFSFSEFLHFSNI